MDLHTSNTESEAGLDHRRAKRTRDLWHVGLNPARSLVECPGTPSACCRRARAALDTRGAKNMSRSRLRTPLLGAAVMALTAGVIVLGGAGVSRCQGQRGADQELPEAVHRSAGSHRH